MPPKPAEPKIETKSVKHVFTPDERNEIGSNLARSIAMARGIEAEFDQVKASYKAKTTEAEARIDSLSTSIMNGFEMRNERCAVACRPADRKKDYWLETTIHHANGMDPKDKNYPPPILTEEMTKDDFQADLLQAESKFDLREEIELFKPTESDRGTLVVGRFAGKWFSALRVNIGKLSLAERLDSEQKSFKYRPDAVSCAVKRASDWAKENLKEHAKGFSQSFQSVIEAHKERIE